MNLSLDESCAGEGIKEQAGLSFNLGRDLCGDNRPYERRIVLRLSRSLSRFETQDIKTQPQFNHYLSSSFGG